MPGNVSFSFLIDRESGTFDIGADYYVPGYDDPETGEQFYETNWSFSYTDSVFGSGFGTSGPGWDSGGGSMSLGFPTGDTPSDAQLGFTASNWFSGASTFASLRILNAGLATAAVTLTIAPTDGDSVLIGGAGDDALTSAGGNDLLDGGDGGDILVGGGGKDILNGGAGGDAMAGGSGDDTYHVDDAADSIAEASGGGQDLVFSAVDFTLSANLEDLILHDPAASTGIGNILANTIYGNRSTNLLDGRDGDDRLFGYEGADQLIGGAGKDTLDGGSGDDRMIGGADDDLYIVDSRGDRIVELAGGGTDEVRVNGPDRYVLAAELETLVNLAALPLFSGWGNASANTLTGADGIDRLHGMGGDDLLQGGDGNDFLEGGAGADALVGGDGSDTASYAGAAEGVTVSLGGGSHTGDAAGDTFSGIEHLVGSAHADRLTGNAADNRIIGGAGDDTLVGGGGRDWLTGGAGADMLVGDGNDGVSYTGSGAAVTVNLVRQTAAGGDATGDVLTGIARAEGSALGDRITGNSAANVLFGGGGADVINAGSGDDVVRGGAGADRLEGGNGIDTVDYTGSTAGVTVSLADGSVSGGDAAGDVLSGFEHIVGSAHNDVLTADDMGGRLSGGDGGDTLVGGTGRDTVIGGAGADAMDGGGGVDTLSYATSRNYVFVNLANGQTFGDDAAGDTFTGFENLHGGMVSDALYGDGARNVIWGGSGGDFIDGAGGDDLLIGGSGDDAYTVTGGSGFDRIRDFTTGGLEDRVVLVEMGPFFATFEQVMDAAVQQGSDTVITFAAGHGLILEGVSKAALTVDDFVF